MVHPWFISGFVDGEGSFHVALNRRNDLPRKWSIIPEFRISQDKERLIVLDKIQQYFNCGRIRENYAASQNDSTYVYIVRNRLDLIENIIPFFRKYPLCSTKQQEFETFAWIVEAMVRKVHLTARGFQDVVLKAFQMNGNGKYRKLKLDEVN